MSSHPHSHDEDIPRFEPWLGVMASSFIPAAIGVYAHSFIAPLTVGTVALFLTSLFMLRRQTLRHRAEQQP